MTHLRWAGRGAALAALLTAATLTACSGSLPPGGGSSTPTPPPAQTGTSSPTTAPATTNSPSPGESQSASPVQRPTPSVTGPVVQKARLGVVVSLRYFDVEVSEVRSDPDGVEIGALVKVCYTHAHPGANADGTTRVSRDPWAFGLLDGEAGETKYRYIPVGKFDQGESWKPLYEARKLKVGECNSGWLSIHHGNPDLWVHYLRYAPADFGDRITWRLDS